MLIISAKFPKGSRNKHVFIYDWKPSMLTFARFSSLFLSLSHVAWEASCFNMLTEGGVVMSKKREKAIRREHTGIFSTCSQTFDEPKKMSIRFSFYPEKNLAYNSRFNRSRLWIPRGVDFSCSISVLMIWSAGGALWSLASIDSTISGEFFGNMATWSPGT